MPTRFRPRHLVLASAAAAAVTAAFTLPHASTHVADASLPMESADIPASASVSVAPPSTPEPPARQLGPGIAAAYERAGGSRGPLGASTSDEADGAPGTRVARFAGGVIVWSERTGSHAVSGAILTAYTEHREDAGDLGAPTSDEQAVDGGVAQDFVGGRVEVVDGKTTVHAMDARCLSVARAVCADKTQRKLRWVVDGRPTIVVDIRTGDPDYTTPEGQFQVLRKVKDEVSYLYNGEAMPYSLYFHNGGWAVHYSTTFAQVGWTRTSHGCVNVRDWDAMIAIYEQAMIGDRVVVYR